MTAPVGITGGTGFLAHAAERYLSGCGRGVRLMDWAAAPDHRTAAAPLTLADIRDAAAVERFVSECSAVIHYAAVVGVDSYLSHAADVIDVNVNGTRLVLEACRKQAKPVLFASTSEVYGMNSERLSEGSASVFGSSASARWCYAVSKSAGEHLARALAKQGLACVITRYFNAYGPLMDRPGEGRVISKFLGRLKQGLPLRLVDGGSAVRSFCYVDDTVRGTCELLFALERGELASGLAFNIGRDEPVSIRELAERLLRLSRVQPGLEDVGGEQAFGDGFEEVPRRVPELSAIREAIGFEAKVDLDTGLARVLEHWGLLAAEPAPRVYAQIPMIAPQFEPSLGLVQELQSVLESGRVSNEGPCVARFEQATAAFLGVDTAIAVSSGTSALELVARALGPGGKVVLPAFTYIATLSAFVNAGFEPVFCDVDPQSYTLDAGALSQVLEHHADVSVVVAVNVYGVPPALDQLAQLTSARNIKLVLDGAHGFGTEEQGLRVSGAALATTYSLHATKALSSVEGGLVVSSDAELLSEVVRLRGHGWAAVRTESTPGMNARLDELRARVGLEQLARLPASLARRRSYAERLRAAALERGAAFFKVQRIPPGVASNFQNLSLRCVLAPGCSVDEVAAAFGAHGVEARRYFSPPLHLLRAYRGKWSLPVTDQLYASLLCLPLHARMPEQVLARIEAALEAVAAQFSRSAGA